MRFRAANGVLLLLLLSAASIAAKQAQPADEYRQLTSVTPLPVALDPHFEIRKAKTFFLGDAPGPRKGAGVFQGVARDPAIGFEASYRLYGAVTALDNRRRFGHYFDFFWRAKREAPITVRLEYRQERLRSFTQAREVTYLHAKGSHRTSFAVIGDDYITDGRVQAWRCLLIAQGRIVAEERSYLWR